MASYTISYDSSSITFKVTGLSRGVSVRLYFRFASGNTGIVDEIYTATGSRLNKTFNGVLSPGKNYVANVKVGDNWLGARSFTSDEEEIKPTVAPWSWSASNGSASSSQTSRAYYAVCGQGNTSDFSYLVWNDMVDKVMEILESKGMTWYSGYASYYDTKMSSRDKELTADRFNALKNNIGSHYPTGIQDVRKGDIVYGWYFTTLTDCMNDWISH